MAQLLTQSLVDEVTFVEPAVLPSGPRRPQREEQTLPAGLRIVRPLLPVPKRLGGLRATGMWLRATALRDADVLWVNDPSLGVHALSPRRPAVYDVTDDWRTFDFPPRIRRRLVAAEDSLAACARTVVCSDVLADRWRERYAVEAEVVRNGIDLDAFAQAVRRQLPGAAPHVGYIGTLHDMRIDVETTLAVADSPFVGTVHLVGPNALSPTSSAALGAHPKIMVHGPVPSGDVPSWTVSMDVLVCPHLINAFTESLDAIKSYEYLSAGRPVVATPTSGFQALAAPDLTSIRREDFVGAVEKAVSAVTAPVQILREEWSWAARARHFHQALVEARSGGPTHVS